MTSHRAEVENIQVPNRGSPAVMTTSATPPAEDPEGWIRVKLQAGIPLDPAEEAYLASLPPTDPLLQILAVPRKMARP